METFSALLALCAGNLPVTGEFPHKGQWRGTFMFSLICAWIHGWENNGKAGDFRRHRALYDFTVMKCLFRRTSKIISKLRVTGLCAGNSPETGEFLAQMASNAEIVSIWWRNRGTTFCHSQLLSHVLFVDFGRKKNILSTEIANFHAQ